MKKDSRPPEYHYWNQLMNCLGGDIERFFDGTLVYPRQLEIHLPSNHKKPCNFNCYYCQGLLVRQPLNPYELKALYLIDKLSGKIPFIIYGGAYSEPLMNPYLTTFLAITKKHNSHFGIHTNGSYLYILEESQGFLTELCRLAKDRQDYLSISLDAGYSASHRRTKNTEKNWFWEIIDGIKSMVKARGNKDYPTIRICYLLNKVNSSPEELESIVSLARDLGIDSLRFSIPYDLYGLDFKKVRHYKGIYEVGKTDEYEKKLKLLLSSSISEKPYIFYLGPEIQDVDKMCFKQCIYGYYQITLGADSIVYKCSSTATPTFPANQLGKIPDTLEELEELIIANQDVWWNPQNCFKAGARCNRMALEINSMYAQLVRPNKSK